MSYGGDCLWTHPSRTIVAVNTIDICQMHPWDHIVVRIACVPTGQRLAAGCERSVATELAGGDQGFQQGAVGGCALVSLAAWAHKSIG